MNGTPLLFGWEQHLKDISKARGEGFAWGMFVGGIVGILAVVFYAFIFLAPDY